MLKKLFRHTGGIIEVGFINTFRYSDIKLFKTFLMFALFFYVSNSNYQKSKNKNDCLLCLQQAS